uniref:LigA n=1 Tax=Parastrongyloides trichosuri TaxID=131310 RepID=A0A0N4ZJN1_PARTI
MGRWRRPPPQLAGLEGLAGQARRGGTAGSARAAEVPLIVSSSSRRGEERDASGGEERRVDAEQEGGQENQEGDPRGYRSDAQDDVEGLISHLHAEHVIRRYAKRQDGCVRRPRLSGYSLGATQDGPHNGPVGHREQAGRCAPLLQQRGQRVQRRAPPVPDRPVRRDVRLRRRQAFLRRGRERARRPERRAADGEVLSPNGGFRSGRRPQDPHLAKQYPVGDPAGRVPGAAGRHIVRRPGADDGLRPAAQLGRRSGAGSGAGSVHAGLDRALRRCRGGDLVRHRLFRQSDDDRRHDRGAEVPDRPVRRDVRLRRRQAFLRRGRERARRPERRAADGEVLSPNGGFRSGRRPQDPYLAEQRPVSDPAGRVPGAAGRHIVRRSGADDGVRPAAQLGRGFGAGFGAGGVHAGLDRAFRRHRRGDLVRHRLFRQPDDDRRHDRGAEGRADNGDRLDLCRHHQRDRRTGVPQPVLHARRTRAGQQERHAADPDRSGHRGDRLWAGRRHPHDAVTDARICGRRRGGGTDQEPGRHDLGAEKGVGPVED